MAPRRSTRLAEKAQKKEPKPVQTEPKETQKWTPMRLTPCLSTGVVVYFPEAPDAPAPAPAPRTSTPRSSLPEDRESRSPSPASSRYSSTTGSPSPSPPPETLPMIDRSYLFKTRRVPRRVNYYDPSPAQIDIRIYEAWQDRMGIKRDKRQIYGKRMMGKVHRFLARCPRVPGTVGYEEPVVSVPVPETETETEVEKK